MTELATQTLHTVAREISVALADGTVDRVGPVVQVLSINLKQSFWIGGVEHVIWFPPGEKHWHGATPTTAMTHIAIQENLDGKVVDWMEKVTDEQYRKE